MSKPLQLTGKCWVIRTAEGKRIDDIDTDMIFHNSYLHITEIEKMGSYAFGNLPGWEDFPKKAKPGDILVVGHNFGCGSSRQQAVDCFIALGISAIVGESFGAIYKRNAINSGLPILSCPGILDSAIKSGDELKIDLDASTIEDLTSGIKYSNVEPFSRVQKDIYLAGNLFLCVDI
jgi:3-isopropylmalate/(R)-2-methylmalate dehydratase small subunit